MALPIGVQTKTLTFGRYTSVLGNNRGGEIKVGFDDPMLHVPTGEVIVADMESVTVNAVDGVAAIPVPVTVEVDESSPKLIANWRDDAAYFNQRVRVDIDITGYRKETFYLDIAIDDPPFIDFDTMSKYAMPTGAEYVRAQVVSVGGLTGVIDSDELATNLQPYIETGELTPEQLDIVADEVQAEMEPPVTLTLLFENALV